MTIVEWTLAKFNNFITVDINIRHCRPLSCKPLHVPMFYRTISANKRGFPTVEL